MLGLCGGYQMLGATVPIPAGSKGPVRWWRALGIWMSHRDAAAKTPGLAAGTSYRQRRPRLPGYEIHLGETTGPDSARAWLHLDDRPEGAASASGRVRGTYLHGLFASDGFRAAFLQELGVKSGLKYDSSVEDALQSLADHVETHLDLDRILELAATPRA